MTQKLPILDEFRALRRFADMADWLGRCPLAMFVTHGQRIEDICMARDFGAGADYVRLLNAGLMRTRALDGPVNRVALVLQAAERMDAISDAERLDPISLEGGADAG